MDFSPSENYSPKSPDPDHQPLQYPQQYPPQHNNYRNDINYAPNPYNQNNDYNSPYPSSPYEQNEALKVNDLFVIADDGPGASSREQAVLFYKPQDNPPHKYQVPQPDQESPNPHSKMSSTPPQSDPLKSAMSYWESPSFYGSALNLCGFFFICANLIIIINLMVYHFGEKDVTLNSVSGALDYMAYNLNADPIMEIVPADSSSSCATGWTPVHLARWPGTDIGCNCLITGLSQRKCKGKESLTCTKIYPRDMIDMFEWGGSALCVKKAQLGTDYVKKAKCPEGFAQCSPGLCMKSSLGCPINSLKFTSASMANSTGQIGTSGKYVTPIKIANDQPLIDLEITKNSIPCFSTNELPKGNGHYKLLKTNPTGCKKYGVDDKYSFEIDRDTEDKVFAFNNFPKKVYDLPGYTQVIQATTDVLSGRKRIPVAANDKCLSLDSGLVDRSGDSARQLDKVITGTVITAAALHSLLCLAVFCIVFSLKTSSNSWTDIIKGKEAETWLGPYYLFGFLELILFMVMTALVSKYRGQMKKSKDYFQTMHNEGCFTGAQPKMVVMDYIEAVDEVAFTLNGYSVALLVISLVGYISVFVIVCYKNVRLSK